MVKDKITSDLMRPVFETGAKYYLTVIVLAGIALWGLFAWVYQLTFGLGFTGMKNSVAWGLYITNFVYFIGISHAGALVSAILRLTNAEWRRPITRVAETIAVFALIFGGIQIVFDLGHPERVLDLIIYGRYQSPLLWDVTCIGIYLMSCIFYLYLPLIPDIATMKDNLPINTTKWRRKFYQKLSIRWVGSEGQIRYLHRVLAVMTVLIIPIAISVHTVVSWVFGMTLRPMWHSTIFGPYFVTGAIYSGIATVIIAMAVMRKAYNLQNYMKSIHFDNFGKLLILMVCLWFYFIFAEFLTTGYGTFLYELKVFHSKVLGEFALIFWGMVSCMVAAFFLLLFRKKLGVIGATTLASIFVDVGMWLERFTIIVPSLTKPLQEGYKAGLYQPTWVEWSITLASFAGFTLALCIFYKLFPVISIWEEKEEENIPEVAKRIETYLPSEEIA